MANPADVLAQGAASRAKPLTVPDTQNVKMRTSREGALYVQSISPGKQVLCEEGSYFVTTNPTPSTAIAYGSAGTQATFVDTVPFIQVINTGNPGDPNAPIVYLDYLRLIISGSVPASTTAIHMAGKLDNGFRAATAGTPAANTPVSANMNLATVKPAAVVVTHSAAVATIPAASSAARLVNRAQLKGGPILSLDEYAMQWGMTDAPSQGGYLTAVAAYTSRLAPVGIGPGQSYTMYLWALSAITNPISYEFELGHWERA